MQRARETALRSRLIAGMHCSAVPSEGVLNTSRPLVVPLAWPLMGRWQGFITATRVSFTGSLFSLGARPRTVVDRLHRRSYATAHEMYNKDLYSILGIKDAATQQEIKAAFYKKAKEYHPDVNKNNPNAQKHFVEATSAYEILRDENKRKDYDGMRRMRTSSSTSYTSYTSYGTDTGSSRARSSRTSDEFPGGMNHEDFARWYQQRGDIFQDFERMFQDIAMRMSRRTRARWYQMFEFGEIDFEDVYDVYHRMHRQSQRTKRREDKQRKKREQKRQKRASQAGTGGGASSTSTPGGRDGPTADNKSRQKREAKNENDAKAKTKTKAKAKTKADSRDGETAEAASSTSSKSKAKSGRRKNRAKQGRDYYWGKWGRKHAQDKAESTGRRSSDDKGDEAETRRQTRAEQKATEDAKRRERRWQKKREEIRRRWHGFYDEADTIVFF